VKLALYSSAAMTTLYQLVQLRLPEAPQLCYVAGKNSVKYADDALKDLSNFVKDAYNTLKDSLIKMVGSGSSGSALEKLILVTGKLTKGNFPKTSNPNEILYRIDSKTGKITFYQVYDSGGYPIKRVDLVGSSHAGIPTPHV